LPRCICSVGINFPKTKSTCFLLGKWSTDEQIQIDTKMNTAVEIVKSFCTIGLANTMNSFNNK